jgi:hypothetical protein
VIPAVKNDRHLLAPNQAHQPLKKHVAALHFLGFNFTHFTPKTSRQNTPSAHQPKTRLALMPVGKNSDSRVRIFCQKKPIFAVKKV